MQDVVSQFREYIRLDKKNRSGGLTPTELERWTLLKRKLGREFTPELSDDRSDKRTSLRVPTQLRVDFASEADARGQLMTNLSRGGLFVATRHSLDLGTRVRLAIYIEPTGERLEVPAEVVSQGGGPHLKSQVQGMGLRFLEVDAGTQRRLDELYERSLQHASLRNEMKPKAG